MNKLTPEMAKQIVKDRKAGMSYSQIAKKHGINKGSAQSVVWRSERDMNVGGGSLSQPKPWAVDELDALKAMAADWVSIDDMARALHRSSQRVRNKLKELLGQPYVRPAELVTAERRANLASNKESVARRNDDLSHCRAIMEADCEGSPKGCGFPVAPARAAYRVAA